MTSKSADVFPCRCRSSLICFPYFFYVTVILCYHNNNNNIIISLITSIMGIDE